jgi:acyl CoA:acetate/3-ketoacid CoA transferase alpha subunit
MVALSSRHEPVEVLHEGRGKYLPVDPDGFRAWVRDNKSRALVPKLMTEAEAVSRFVSNGDYLAYDCNYIMRGPNSVLHEIIRQGKRDLWLCGKFTYIDVALLVAAGVANRVDCGFFMAPGPITQAVREGRLSVYEYSNVVMTLRLQAGAMGLPFLPVRSFGGTHGFDHSGAKLISDPFTGQPITVVPALNPDVAVVHVHQADKYGNARVFGVGISHADAALASKKVIISAEEIVDTEVIRSDPGRTSIPYYVVDAVVEAPYGTYPGNCPGYYASNPAGVMEVFAALQSVERTRAYVDKYVSSVANHQEMLEQRVGLKTLLDMKRRETIKEGYR